MPHICEADRIKRYQRIQELRAAGCTYDQIADRLSVCRNTVGCVIRGEYIVSEKPAKPHSLSKSQLSIARLMVQGFSNEKIAIDLFRSRKNIDWHVYTIYKKLGLLGNSNISRRVVAVSILKDILERSLQ